LYEALGIEKVLKKRPLRLGDCGGQGVTGRRRGKERVPTEGWRGWKHASYMDVKTA
jgi:hypothetical protein